ncbi:hypothetical protein DFJ74DRAFT_661573 [Hyaloraphidium curvatum]|nr:hypothetical protein DFJ74DRAFT_661573 [Hyaloraphidium curvatum]
MDPSPGLQDLPPEILRAILSYDSLSLGDLFGLQLLCRTVLPEASWALLRRVKHVLTVDKDPDTFFSFVESLRGPERVAEEDWEGKRATDGWSEEWDKPLDAEVVGRILRLAGVQVESIITFSAIRRYKSRLTLRNGTIVHVLDPDRAGDLLDGMSAGGADVALVVRHLNLLSPIGEHAPRAHYVRLGRLLRPISVPHSEVLKRLQLPFAQQWMTTAIVHHWINGTGFLLDSPEYLMFLGSQRNGLSWPRSSQQSRLGSEGENPCFGKLVLPPFEGGRCALSWGHACILCPPPFLREASRRPGFGS